MINTRLQEASIHIINSYVKIQPAFDVLMGQQPSKDVIAKPQINVSAQLPWDPSSTMIGGGYDNQKYCTRQTPFVEPPELETLDRKAPVDIKYSSYLIRDEEDLEEGIKFSFGVCMPTSTGATTDVSFGYLHGIKCSSTSLTTIISCTIDLPSEKSVSRPQFTPEADALLVNGPKKFIERHGQYFISGQQKRSTFIAVCTHSASSKEQLDGFNAKLGADFGVGSFDAAVDYMKEVKSSNLSTKIEIHVTGLQAKKVEHFSTMDPVPALKAFMKGYAPVPHLALLTDYSCIDARVPQQTKTFTYPRELEDAFQKACTLEVRAQSCQMKGAQKMLADIAKLRQELTGIQLSASDWQDCLSKCNAKLEMSQQQVNKWYERRALLHRCRELSSKPWSTSKWLKVRDTTEWQTGLCHTQASKSLTSEVRLDRLRFPEDSRDGKALRHSYADRHIIGAKVVSRGLDETARWRLKEGCMGDIAMAVEFKTDGYKVKCAFGSDGCNFNVQREKIACALTVEVWSVDSELYARAP